MAAVPDPSLAKIFADEVAEIVETLHAHLLRVRGGTLDAKTRLADMLRLTHDVKGSARVVGYQQVSRLAHALESRLQRWRGADAVAPAEIGLAQTACDLLLQLTCNQEPAELVPLAAELMLALEDPSSVAAVVPPPASEPAAASATAPRVRPAGPRSVPSGENLRVSRRQLDDMGGSVADALVALLACKERLDELQSASHELRKVHLPRPGASKREVGRARGEAENAITRVRRAVSQLADALRPLDTDLRAVDECARELCLVPFEPLTNHLERVARDTAALLGREVEFAVEGRDSLIDKELADAVKGPLTHAVRNAVDHGIEPPAERERAGKPRAGQLTLSLIKDEPSLRLTLRDDGRGIDHAAVRARLGPASDALDDHQLLATLLRAGVSTRETVTEISGRGVGLGSLSAAAQDLRGDVTLISEPHGGGTTVELRLPLKLSLSRGLVVRVGGHHFVVPVDSLVAVKTDWPTAVPLAGVLGLAGAPAGREVVVIRGRDGCAGVTVEHVDDRMREVVRRPLGAHLGRARFVEGVTILGDGQPALILDAREVAEACPLSTSTSEPAAPEPDPGPASGGRRVLVVDDSPTLRLTLQQSLTRAGFDVLQAGDGLEALAQLSRTSCHAIVSDVQMPRMDGWQLLARCGGRVPFVLMTARPEPDGATRARQAGACAYITKDDALGERVTALLHTALIQLQESLP
jgi:chemotaxis protein histidine kinase CheA